ncbi:MAG: 6-phosphogluconolactonase [Verrucomicrobiae bacterium]|nr:6-phosphogluconolactonase [Verrucomicrobiae bacterium]
MRPLPKLLTCASTEEWLDLLVQDFKALAGETSSRGKPVHVALCGGETPRPFYEALRQTALPWPQIHWWLGDERCVPIDDPYSNQRMICETLGKDHPSFEKNWHPWPSDVSPDEAARLYEKELGVRLGTPPVFDLILLGIGEDGHTASLFPGSPALEITGRMAVVNRLPEAARAVGASERLTLTYPVLNAARQVWFLVSGEKKRSWVEAMERDPDGSFPAARVKAANQTIHWRRDA